MFEAIKDWVTGEVIAYTITAVLALGGLGGLVVKISRTFKEIGEFMTAIGNALADSKMTGEELNSIVKEGKDVFSLWKKTPDRFKVK